MNNDQEGDTTMFLSSREKRIIEILIKYRETYIRIYDIAQQLGVSSRTIHRELKHVESYLETFAIVLERVSKQGIRIVGHEYDMKRLFKDVSENTAMDLSLEEQKVIILYALIQTKEPIKQFSLAEEIGVSIQTLSKLLDELSQDIHLYQLSISRKRGEGIQLLGPESKKREFLSQLMVNKLNSTSVYSVIENHFVYQSLHQSQQSLVNLEQIFQVERILMDDLGRLPYSLTESSYLSLTIHIVLGINRMKNDEYVAINDEIYDSVKTTLEQEIARDIASRLDEIYDVKFNEAEITFITIHLRGAKRKDFRADKSEQSDLKTIIQFVDAVEQISGQHFEDRANLIEGLKLHIHPAINRLSSNIETYNPLTQMIQYKYPLLFKQIKQAQTIVWPELVFPDSEIAFIVLHFGGSIKRHKKAPLNLLVVCSSGVGTSRLLAARLKNTFRDIERITQASVSDLNHLNLESFDGIISTVNLDIKQPFITVNPLLPESDITYVSHFLKLNATHHSNHETHTKILMKDNENLINTMRDAVHLIDSMKIEHRQVDNWSMYIANHLLNEQAIPDVNQFSQYLQEKIANHPGWLLAPYPVAIPHLRDSIILKPVILVTILDTPIKMSNMQADDFKVKYMISMFIPDNEEMAQLVSQFIEEVGKHLEDIETFMKEPEKLRTILKSKISEKIKNFM